MYNCAQYFVGSIFSTRTLFTRTTCVVVHGCCMTPGHCVRFCTNDPPGHYIFETRLIFTLLRPVLGCSSPQANVVVLLHLLTFRGILLVGVGCQSLFSCFSVNSDIISRLRNESNMWQENTEESSLLPSADHWLLLQTTATVMCFADYKTNLMITYSAHEFRRCYINYETKHIIQPTNMRY
jgi:hypothetical protein